ncbi:MAG: hypothetical protein K9L19_10110 [Desulfarculaceae bacterium]|nr:hypothetical protein [Desulfarculaceae bacterium]MCF8047888.1 hypothetical protein [Desulfarculaceae bacterium]MCF8122491.1 hypothetical protein [Desulfarculaceae bacterium]
MLWLIKKPAAVHLAAGGLMSLAAAVLLRWLWGFLVLPDAAPADLWGCVQPWGLRRFAFLILPGMALVGSLCLELLLWLAPPGRRPTLANAASKARAWDLATYALLGSVALGAWWWGRPGAGMLPLALGVVVWLTAKGALVLWLLWSAWLRPQEGAALGWRRHVAIFLAVFCILAMTSLWVKQASSTAGDEVSYLLMAQSLASHGTLDQQATVLGKEYRDFYFCRWSDGLRWTMKFSHSYFPLFLYPPYALGGRLGVMLFFAGIMALLAGQLYAWLLSAGLGKGVAALSAGLVLFAAPVLCLGQHALVEAPGMLLLVVGLRLAMAVPRRPLTALLGLLTVSACLYFIKFRLAALGGGLLVAAVFWWLVSRVGARRALPVALGAAVLAVLAVLAPSAGCLPHSYFWGCASFSDELRCGLDLWARCGHLYTPLWVMFGGLALDQAFGLLLTAPVMLLALAGIPAALRRHPRPALTALVPVVIYVGMVCLMRWYRWQGGFDLPARLYLVAFPALALFLGIMISALARPWWRLVAWAVSLWGLAYTLVVVLIPALRWGRSGLINPAVSLAQDRLGLTFYHLLPSTFVYSPLLPWLAALTALGLVGLAWLAWRNSAFAQAGAWRLPAKEALALALGLALLVAAPLAGAKLWPPRALEAELMRGGPHSPLWVENAFPWDMRGRSLSSGSWITGRLFFPGGAARLRLVARAGSLGRVVLSLDGRTLPGLAFSKGHRLEVILPQVSRGWHQLRLTWRSCPGRDCYLLVDRLELLPGGPG